MQKKKVSHEDHLNMEEKTHAMTPDKMDRSRRETTSESRQSGGKTKLYPLTEEEATPTVPDSEKQHTG